MFLTISLLIILILCLTLAIRPSLFQRLFTNCPSPTNSRRPSLGTTETKITSDTPSYQFPPLRPKTNSRMAMGLKRLDHSNWLTLDSFYLPEHIQRISLFNTRYSDVIQVLPGTEDACHEVLSIVTTFLYSRFPEHFTISSSSHPQTIINHLTNEKHIIGPDCKNPLEIAARLSMEDFNILMKDKETGEYCLRASATLFPAGWKLRERIGFSMARLHGPVPGWKSKLGGSVGRYFDHLSSKTAMERTNLFIQCTPALFQDCPEPPLQPNQILLPKDLMVRRERQTFTRLPKTDGVLFTVRTYMRPLLELDDDEVKALRGQVLGWEEEVRMYKGWALWGDVLMEFCEGRVGMVEEEGEEKGGEKVEITG